MKKVVLVLVFLLVISGVYAALPSLMPVTGKPLLIDEGTNLKCVPQQSYLLVTYEACNASGCQVITERQHTADMYHVYDWLKNGTSVELLNAQFEEITSLNGSVKDYSTGSHNGSVFYGTFKPTEGFDGSDALEIINSNGYVNFGKVSAFDPNGTYTWNVWVRPYERGRNQKIISQQASGVGGYDIRLDSDAYVRFVSAYNWGSYRTYGKVNLEQWNNIIVTYNKGAVEITINGVKQTLETRSNPIFRASSDDLKLGARGQEHFEGMVDNFRMYNTLMVNDVNKMTKESGVTCAVTPHARKKFGVEDGSTQLSNPF